MAHSQAQTSPPSSPRSAALVIGAGIAGQLAARVLADHFDRVTVIERDRFPEDPRIRRGIPQARHVHIILVRGYSILSRLFPELDTELELEGAPEIDLGQDGWFHLPSGWSQRGPTGMLTRSCSRALLEWKLYCRLREHPGIEFVEGARVTGLVDGPDGKGITGVHVAGEDGRVVRADLIVDASGRESRAPEWLEALGFTPPRETIVNSFLGYASRRILLPADRLPDWKMLAMFPNAPDAGRGGVLLQEEGSRWIVTLSGVGRDYPPTDEAGFMAFAASLPDPYLHEMIQGCEPLEPIAGFRRTENRLRHYERLSRWPENFVLLGDAVCAFNPVYGQGMSVSAIGAQLLDDELRRRRSHPGGFARRFQRRLARTNRLPWLLATGEDLRYPETEGPRPAWYVRLMQRYVDHVFLSIPNSIDASVAFLSVIHLAKSPLVLFRPRVLAHALRTALRGGRSRRVRGAHA